MKTWSGHIYFDDKFEWSRLEKAFPDIYSLIVENKKNPEDQQFDQVLLQLNLEEMHKNKKPIGYIKDDAKYKLVFPLDRKEMIVYRGVVSDEVREKTEEIEKVLKSKKIRYTVDYDKMILYQIRKAKK
ncbi:hypothetical protein [Thermoplasma acidophilum]|uniref:Uncharacterized protein n=1 Tax=Thermoplasma acidophilum (strain ATCC 25905 / DSM 1728 / JCM 9062 / NBRC 15155 / AMRC-C165) TaxID=273075 RepID=Q9HIN3_THEAC|nr:hypothetical protein [Thermoplasma acidophilum]CAC12424.1 hypothetical protein [Thermoplasma acidophilum]